MSGDTALAFWSLSIWLALTPGPDNMFVMAQSVQSGARSGWVVVLGLCTGLMVHTTAVALGLAAALASMPRALQAIQLLGAGYLLYLAWGAWHAPAAPLQALEPGPSPQRESARRGSLWPLWRRGLFMNLSNPKVGLFFLALLPQFVDPTQGAAVPQIAMLGALFMLATLLVFGSISYFAGKVADVIRGRPGIQRVLARLSSVVLALLGLRLLATL